MSTQISITVDQGGLLERNRQQTIANRQSSNEATSTRQAGNNAAEQLQAVVLRSNSRPSQAVRPRFHRDELAANRFNLMDKVYFGPLYDPIVVSSTAPYYTQHIKYFLIDSIKKKGPEDDTTAIALDRFYYKCVDYAWAPEAGGEFTTTQLVEGAGPGGANALVTQGYGMNLSIQYPDGWFSGPQDDNIGFYEKNATFECYVKQVSLWKFTFTVGDFRFTVTDTDASVRYDTTTEYLPFTVADFETWAHLAVVFANSTLTIYLNGIAKASIAYPEPEAYLRLWTWTFPYGDPLYTLYLSGLKVVNKALYRSNFTPPASIQ